MANDFCNEEGAKRLKNKIEDYWTSRGYDVSINLVDAGFVPAMRSARTDVRSDMVNGMPSKKKPSEGQGGRKPAPQGLAGYRLSDIHAS